MLKTTFTGYVPKLKLKGAEATIVGGKAHQSKGGSIRYSLQGEYEGHKTLPKTVSKEDFENVYGFDAKEAEAVYIKGNQDHNGVKNPQAIYHQVGMEDREGFETTKIIPIENKKDAGRIITEEMDKDERIIHNVFPKSADTVGSPSPASVEPPAPSEKPFPQEPSNENFSAEYTEDDICFVCSNPDTENEVTYCESDADCGKAICDDCRYEEMQGGKWVKLDEDPEDDNSAMADVCRECADNNEPVLFEAFGLFGDKDEEEKEEEKEPETQEFTVVMQPGDKLELTDIPDEKTDSGSEKGEDNDESEEKVEKEAVVSKITRPVEEEETKEESDEGESDEGVSTATKVGLGTLAVLGGLSLLGAEDEESDYWEGETIQEFEEYRSEDVQKMTSSEFVPFDQITSEIQEQWDETTPSIAADYQPSNEPSNANFSAEDEAIDRKVAKGEITAEEGEILKEITDPTQRRRRYTQMRRRSDPTFRKDFSKGIEGNYDADTIGSPSPSGPSSTPEPAEATGSEPSNEHMEAEMNKNLKYLVPIGLTVAGLFALGQSDNILKFFDRFKR